MFFPLPFHFFPPFHFHLSRYFIIFLTGAQADIIRTIFPSFPCCSLQLLQKKTMYKSPLKKKHIIKYTAHPTCVICKHLLITNIYTTMLCFWTHFRCNCNLCGQGYCYNVIKCNKFIIYRIYNVYIFKIKVSMLVKKLYRGLYYIKMPVC